MNKKILIIIAIITHLVSVIPKTHAEESLSLEKALSLAYENNPDMIEAGKSIDASKGGMITARSFSNPEFEFEISGLKKNEEGERNPHLGTFAMLQSFDPPGVRGLKSKISKHQVSAQEESIKVVWSQIYAEIRETYSHIILDKKAQELAQMQQSCPE